MIIIIDWMQRWYVCNIEQIILVIMYYCLTVVYGVLVK